MNEKINDKMFMVKIKKKIKKEILYILPKRIGT